MNDNGGCAKSRREQAVEEQIGAARDGVKTMWDQLEMNGKPRVRIERGDLLRRAIFTSDKQARQMQIQISRGRTEMYSHQNAGKLVRNAMSRKSNKGRQIRGCARKFLRGADGETFGPAHPTWWGGCGEAVFMRKKTRRALHCARQIQAELRGAPAIEPIR